MKKLIILLLAIGLVASCNEDADDTNPNSIVGTWKLTEIYNDPGDGSGTFQPIESDRTISFHENGTFTSNGQLCNNYSSADSPSSGTYSMTDSTFTTTCNSSETSIRFGLNGKKLSIAYTCIEGCGAIYTKQ